jgi:hypothetical protein
LDLLLVSEFIKVQGECSDLSGNFDAQQTKILNPQSFEQDNKHPQHTQRLRKFKSDQEAEDELARAIEASLQDLDQNTTTNTNNTNNNNNNNNNITNSNNNNNNNNIVNQNTSLIFSSRTPVDTIKSSDKKISKFEGSESPHPTEKRKYEETNTNDESNEKEKKRSRLNGTKSEKKCTLHIRTPAGDVIVGTFDSLDTLATVHRFVAAQRSAGVPSTSFTFTTAFPRKTFALHDLHTITLQDAGLVPRAVLIIEDIS